MKILGTFTTILLAGLVIPSDAYRILCLFPFHGKSHFMMFGALCRGLAKRGHQIDMISHFPTKSPSANYTDIVNLSGTLRSVVNSFSIDYAKSLNEGLMAQLATTFGGDLCHLMGHPDMQKFIKNPPKDPPYDLIITEMFGSSCFLGFGPYLNVTVAVAISSAEYSYMNDVLANPYSTSFHPAILLSQPVLNGFWERVDNTWHSIVDTLTFFWYSASQTEMVRKHLGQHMPDVRQLERSISLALFNTHYSLYGVRPLTPAYVEVGGLHVPEDTTKLTPELEKWLDSATDGVVYFTLGSLVNIETMPTRTLLDIYKSFAKIAPIKVLMKIANKDQMPPGLPSNVLISSWIPQVPVLRHKNTRLFITHGGLMGSQEALYYGVPIIGIPLFADQMRNINIFVHKHMGVVLDIDKLNGEVFDAALDKMLFDPSYRAAAKKESRFFRDRPLTFMDTAIFWVEYVIRNGPNSLKSPAVNMPWWQTNLVDVYAFFLISALALAYTFVITLRIGVKLLRSSDFSFNSSVRRKVD